MSESNTAVGRALPLWPYSASDNVNRARNSESDKMAFNLCMSFVDYPWRFVTVPPPEIQLRLYQNLAHGGVLALNMHSPTDQEDQPALLAARPVSSGTPVRRRSRSASEVPRGFCCSAESRVPTVDSSVACASSTFRSPSPII